MDKRNRIDERRIADRDSSQIVAHWPDISVSGSNEGRYFRRLREGVEEYLITEMWSCCVDSEIELGGEFFVEDLPLTPRRNARHPDPMALQLSRCESPRAGQRMSRTDE